MKLNEHESAVSGGERAWRRHVEIDGWWSAVWGHMGKAVSICLVLRQNWNKYSEKEEEAVIVLMVVMEVL